MQRIDHDPRYVEPPFLIQEAISALNVGDSFFMRDIVSIPWRKNRTTIADKMKCLQRTGQIGPNHNVKFRKVFDPRLVFEITQAKFSNKPGECWNCRPAYNTCLILRAYQNLVRKKIAELQKVKP